MTTLTEILRQNQSLVAVSDPDDIVLDRVYQIEEEYVIARSRPRPGGKIFIGRGFLGSVRAEHAASTELTLVHVAVQTDTPSAPPPAEVGGSAQVVYTQSVTLTNDEIKALPTTPVTLVDSPGAGQVLVPVSAFAVSEFSANDYTNVNVNAFMVLAWGLTSASTNAWVGNATWFDAWGGPGQGRVCGFLLAPTLALRGTDVITETGRQDIDDQPLCLVMNNHSDGDLTGGDAGNTLKIVVAYMIVAMD